ARTCLWGFRQERFLASATGIEIHGRKIWELTMPVTCDLVITWRRSWHIGICVLGLAAIAGCSSSGRTFPTGEVSGKITFKGEAISLGKITFISTGATGDFGTGIINDGVYKLDAPLGPCKIEVQMQTDETKYSVSPQQMKMIKAK